MRIIALLFFFSIVVFLPLRAQEKGDLDYVFTSLQEARQNPAIVYRLNLERSKLKEIPQEIFLFHNLRYLNLRKNKISQLPAEIGSLNQLEELNLSNNNIYLIPPQIEKLQELKSLYLARNDVEKLPSQLGELKQLKELDVWLNNIKHIDENIYQLKQLLVFDLRGMLIQDEVKKNLIKQLPNTKILLSGGCDCAF